GDNRERLEHVHRSQGPVHEGGSGVDDHLPYAGAEGRVVAKRVAVARVEVKTPEVGRAVAAAAGRAIRVANRREGILLPEVEIDIGVGAAAGRSVVGEILVVRHEGGEVVEGAAVEDVACGPVSSRGVTGKRIRDYDRALVDLLKILCLAGGRQAQSHRQT